MNTCVLWNGTVCEIHEFNGFFYEDSVERVLCTSQVDEELDKSLDLLLSHKYFYYKDVWRNDMGQYCSYNFEKLSEFINEFTKVLNEH